MSGRQTSGRRLGGALAVVASVVCLTGWARPAPCQQRPAPAGALESNAPADQAPADVPPDVLTREDAIGETLRNNFGIDISRTRTDIARRNVTYGNAGFLPTLSAQASQTHVFGGTGLFGGDDIRTQTQLGVQLDWLVFGGLGRFATYRRLQSQQQSQSLETQAQIESTLVDVSSVYWNVVRQRRIRAALAETRAISKKRVAIARARLQAGSGSRVDVNVARVQLNEDVSDLAEQNIALERARISLNNVLARPPDRRIRVKPEVSARRNLDYQALRTDALAQNRRIRAAQAQTAVGAERIKEARATLWPTLSVSLGYNYSEYHADIAPSFNTEPGLEYGIQLGIPIFEGFNRLRQIDNAQSRQLIASTALDQQRSRVVADLRTRWEVYRRQTERIDLARESVGLARDNTDVALASLKAGTISQFDLQQVQLDLLDAQIRLINAQVTAKQAEVRLLKLAGRLYDTWVDDQSASSTANPPPSKESNP